MANPVGQPLVRDRIRPTVIIGVGGTGKQTLMRIRRRFFDRYGSLRNFPSVAYLYMDTDTNDLPDASVTTSAVVSDAIEFQRDEKLSITVSETLPYVQNVEGNSYITEWFYPGLREKPSLMQGAGSIRPYGRLAFFVNYPKIRTALSNILRNVKNMGSVQTTRDHGLRVDDTGLDVFIVGSIAGGTGSGLLLDTTFLIRDLERSAKRYGFIVLPSVFGLGDSADSRYGNGYAALKEINHYTHRPDATVVRADGETGSVHDFRPKWDPDGERRDLAGPPFNYLYLVDGNNENDVNLGAEGIYDLVAEAIYYEFAMTEFGAHKRSLRDNSDQYLGQVAELRRDNISSSKAFNRPQPKHYSGFGIARITFPIEQVGRACGALLSQKIVSRWVAESAAEISGQVVDDYLQTVIRNVRLTEPRGKGSGGGLRRDSTLLFDLAGAGIEGKTIYDELNTGLYRLRDDAMKAAGQRPVAAMLRAWQADQEIEYAGWESEQPSAGHSLARKLRDNLQLKKSRTTQALQKEIDAVLSDPTRGLGFAQAMIQRLYDLLNEKDTGYVAYYGSERTKAESARNIARQQLNTALQELEMDGDHMSQIHPWRRMTIQTLAGRAIDLMATYFQRQLDAAVATYAERFATWLRDQVRKENTDGLRGQLDSVQTTLKQVRDHLGAQQQRFSQVRHLDHELVLFEDGDLPEIYKDLLRENGESVEEKVVAQLGDEAMKATGGSLFQLVEQVRKSGPQPIADRVLETCAHYFAAKLVAEPRFEVVRRFNEKFVDATTRMDRLMHLTSSAKAWLRFRRGYPGYAGAKCDYNSVIVGWYDPQDGDQTYAEFRRSLQTASGAAVQLNFHASDNRYEVILYCEVAGYPLFLLETLPELREKYKAARDQNKWPHIDQNEAIFADLMPMSAEEYPRHKQRLRSFLLAQALGILKVDLHEQSHRPVFVLPIERGYGQKPKDEYLGYEDTALDRLEQHSDFVSAIGRQIDRRIAEIDKAGAKQNAAFYAVLTHYMEEIYPERLKEGQGGSFNYENLAHTEVLADETARILGTWESSDEWRKYVDQFLPTLREGSLIPFTRLLAPGIKLGNLSQRVVLDLAARVE